MGTSKRSTDWKASGMPGPGSYNPPVRSRQASPGWRMGTASRSVDRKTDVPGPGSYNSPGKISKTSPRIGFGVKSPTSLKDYTPGPGSYEPFALRGYDHKAPSYTMRPRSANPDGRAKVPGPGTYDATSRIQNQTSPSFKMGTSKRDDLYGNTSAPGPGAYNTRPNSAFNRESGPKYGFGSSERDPLYGMSKTLPGPGQYDLKSNFEGTNSKGMSLVPRRPDSALVSASRSPGPGAYNPGIIPKDTAPAFRIGTASRDSGSKERQAVPGPGNYEPKLILKNSNIKIGTSVRSPLSSTKNTPGPGTYDYAPKVGEGPKHIISPRREGDFTTMKYVPGPGAYNPSVSLVKDHNPAVKMGTSNRADLYGSKTAPGPGQYDVRGNIVGPKWGFGSESRGREGKSAVPGPGSYNVPSKIGDVPKYAYGNAPLKIHL